MSESEKRGGVWRQVAVAALIALFAGSTAPWWWKELFPSQPVPVVSNNIAPSKDHSSGTTNSILQLNHRRNNSISPPSPVPQGKPTKINWTNIDKYFVVKKAYFEKGYAKGDSQLRFILTAKGNFSGSFQAIAFDEDGVKICPEMLYTPFSGCVSYNLGVLLENNANQLYSFWQKGEAQWADVIIPHNATKLQLSFAQQY